jgi:hypothetical protein
MQKLLILLIILCPNIAYGYWPYIYPNYYTYYYYTLPRPQAPKITKKQLYEKRIENLNAEKAYDDRVLSLGLERKEAELENAKQWAAVRAKEELYIKKGYLPPKPNPKFYYKGKDYGSFSYFSKQPEFQEYLAEIEERHQREAWEKEQKAIYWHRRFMDMRRMDAGQINRMVVKSDVSNSLKEDILSGRYSTEETRKMLNLLETLHEHR